MHVHRHEHRNSHTYIYMYTCVFTHIHSMFEDQTARMIRGKSAEEQGGKLHGAQERERERERQREESALAFFLCVLAIVTASCMHCNAARLTFAGCMHMGHAWPYKAVEAFRTFLLRTSKTCYW